MTRSMAFAYHFIIPIDYDPLSVLFDNCINVESELT